MIELLAGRDIALSARHLEKRRRGALVRLVGSCACACASARPIVTPGARSLAALASVALGAPAFSMKSFQIFAGRVPPATPFIGLWSSLPTQTPTTSESVNPMNHASL
jgi:hypothetical protein